MDSGLPLDAGLVGGWPCPGIRRSRQEALWNPFVGVGVVAAVESRVGTHETPMEPSAGLHLQLLGPLVVSRDGVALEGATTNKIESYNGFAKWFSFGGDVIAENEPEEQQKRLRYNDLIASAVILQNTADLMQALRTMVSEGIKVNVADIEFLSPYLTHNIKRFGDYKLHLERVPEAWIRDGLFAGPARAVRRARHA